MRYLGIDYGTRRVGIAISNEKGTMAFPKTVVPNNGQLIHEIDVLCSEYDVSCIVMGESRDTDNTPNAVFEEARSCAKELERATGLPVVWEREDFTSETARESYNPRGSVDASAAALILQSYLDIANDAS